MNVQDFAQKYLSIVKGPLSGLNLTRILDLNEFLDKQVLDSLRPFRESDLLAEEIRKTSLVIDVGCGGGFPIFPLAISYPDQNFLGIDSIGKKIEACKFIRNEIKISNVKFYNSRIENILIDKPCIILFKAVGPIPELLRYLKIAPGIEVKVLFYKGPKVEEELSTLKNKDWNFLGKHEYYLADRSYRTTLMYQFVPRGTTNLNKVLVKLSELNLQ